MSRQNRSRYLMAILCCAGGVIALTARPLARALPAASPQDRVNAAFAALGGDKLNILSLKARLEQFDPGESYSVSDPAKPDTGVSELAQSRDLQRELVRDEWVRPKPDDGGKRTYTEIVTPTAGYVIGNDATNGRLPKRTVKGAQPQHTMSGRRLTATLRELERPFIVLEMKRHPDRVSAIADQTIAGKTYPAVQYRDAYGTYIVMFDPATNLPARVRTLDWDALEGDSSYDADYSDWREVSGAKIPFHALYALNGMKVADLKLSTVTVNPALPPKTFDIPQAMMTAAAKPAPANATPYQWIIRRQHVGGMRTYAAEGATIVMAKEDGDYFRKVLARPETLNPDAPKKPFTPKVVEVDGKWSISDAGREVDAYMVENPHAADMMIVYVPDAKLGIVTDLYVPGEPPPSNANVAALVKGVNKWGIKPERFAGGHGSVGPYADVIEAAQRAPAK